MKKYFIVSPPRTGTKSMCKMVSILGFTFKHVPSTALKRLLNENKIQVFADTPIYVPSVINTLIHNENHKFIYCDRDIDEWLDSFERVNLHKNYTALLNNMIPKNGINDLDRTSLGEFFSFEEYNQTIAKLSFINHREYIIDAIPKEKLLIYNFKSGWVDLCKFVNKDIPDCDIPHLNKNSIYEIII